MSEERGESLTALTAGELRPELIAVGNAAWSCQLDAEGHCITCSDEALPVTVLHVDSETGLALVAVKDTTEEIDISLVDTVAPGDVLLVHGGVAIGYADEASHE